MAITVTANDEPTEIEADVDKRFSSIIVNLPVRQTGTGTPSPSNPRPFTMWTDVSLYVSDTEEADEPTLAIELPTPMYGGKIDMVRGEIATLYNSKESGTDWEMTEEGQFRCQVSAYNNGDETSTNVADLYAVHYETVSNKDAYDATDDLTCGLATIAGTTYLYVNDAQYTTLESFATHIADEVFVFRAHIPMSDVTEPHIVYLPEGTSYVWADAGFVDYTVSGTPPLSLPNSLGKPLKAWSVEVSPYQEGTGDPSPDNVRAIHGTDKLNMFVEESYDQSATPKAVLTLPQTVYTGTIGSEGGVSRWGEVDLGTLNWIVNNEEAHIFRCNPPNIKPVAIGDYSGRNMNAICEAYKPSNNISISINMDDMSWLRTSTQYFVRDTNYSTLSDFVASVSGVKLIYELETAAQFAVTSPSIPTPRGTATTWATAEDGVVDSMEVTYVGKAI